MTNITFDLRQGGGTEPLTGAVTFTPTRTNYAVGSVTMPQPQTVGLHNGKATMTGVTPTPSGASPAWAYKVTVINGVTGDAKSWLAAVPNTSTVDFDALTRPVEVVNPTIDPLALDGQMVQSATISGDNLTFTLKNGTVLNAGNARGPKGNDGAGIPAGGSTNQVPVRTADGGSAWASVAGLVPAATTAAAGLMSAADKARLNAAPTSADLTTAQAGAVTSAKAYADGLVGNQVAEMATKDTLLMQFTLASGWSGSTPLLETSVAQNHTPLTFPFPVKIVSLSLLQDRADIPVDTTNFMAVTWRTLRASGAFETVANKRTNARPWLMRKPFSFDGETQTESAKTLAAGDSINLSFSVAGTGKYYFPIYGVVRWRPL